MVACLPDGHGQLGRTAGSKILEELKKDVITYDQAVHAAGFESHSQLDFDGEVFDALPYYGEVLERHVAFGSGDPADIAEKRYGKLANPTVHVALNQIRRLVNDLAKRFGAPKEIVVELARELPLSAKGKRELERLQNDNKEANDERRETLKEKGLSDSYDNRLRLRLWEELNPDHPLDRRCPYTGEQIGWSRLFSDQVETRRGQSLLQHAHGPLKGKEALLRIWCDERPLFFGLCEVALTYGEGFPRPALLQLYPTKLPSQCSQARSPQICQVCLLVSALVSSGRHKVVPLLDLVSQALLAHGDQPLLARDEITHSAATCAASIGRCQSCPRHG